MWTRPDCIHMDVLICLSVLLGNLYIVFHIICLLCGKFPNIPVSISGPKDDDFLLFWFRAVAEQQKHQSITLPKQSWPYGALMEAKCWLAACCSWVEDIFLHNDPWLRWGGQRWQWEAEAPGDARGSLVLFSVWALLAVFGNSEQKNKKETQGGVLLYTADAETSLWQSILSSLRDAAVI